MIVIELERLESKMKRELGYALAGLVVGMLVAGMLFWSLMPGMMLSIRQSKYDFESTTLAVENSIKEHGWMLPKVYDLQASLHKAGYDDMTKMKIFSLCQPEHAYNILSPDADKRVSAIMPCRVRVYEDHSGKVFVTGMNLGLMSKMFGGNIAKVMGKVSSEEHEILKDILVN